MNKSILTKILLFTSMFFWVGCSQSINPETTQSAKSISTEAFPFPTAKLASPTPLLDPTIFPTISERSPLEATPKVTLDSAAVQQQIARLMQTNDRCSTGCFWGIVPGKTSYEEAVRFLDSLKIPITGDDSEDYVYNRSLDYSEGRIIINIRFENSHNSIDNFWVKVGELYRQQVNSENWIAFRPDNYLKVNGIPEKVTIKMGEGPNGRISYEMNLFFKQGSIKYGGNQTIFLPQHILHVCPLIEHNIEMFELRLGKFKIPRDNGDINLTDISEITPQEFHQLLTGDPDNACFDLDWNKYKSRR